MWCPALHLEAGRCIWMHSSALRQLHLHTTLPHLTEGRCWGWVAALVELMFHRENKQKDEKLTLDVNLIFRPLNQSGIYFMLPIHI